VLLNVLPEQLRVVLKQLVTLRLAERDQGVGSGIEETDLKELGGFPGQSRCVLTLVPGLTFGGGTGICGLVDGDARHDVGKNVHAGFVAWYPFQPVFLSHAIQKAVGVEHVSLGADHPLALTIDYLLGRPVETIVRTHVSELDIPVVDCRSRAGSWLRENLGVPPLFPGLRPGERSVTSEYPGMVNKQASGELSNSLSLLLGEVLRGYLLRNFLVVTFSGSILELVPSGPSVVSSELAVWRPRLSSRTV